MSNATPSNTYTHGHHESVLRSHTWRTAANSCAYLLPYLKPDMHVLDVGCGPGTISVDLAALHVPQGNVVGIDPSAEVIQQAEEHASQRGVPNVSFLQGDLYALGEEHVGKYDVIHAHQVLQHVSDPVRALKALRRAAKPGGLVAVRDADYGTFTWFPENAGVSRGFDVYARVARHNGGEPNAGRRLLSWALQAGFVRESITAGSSTWCYSTKEEIEWWSGLWADRLALSRVGSSALENGFVAGKDELEEIGRGFRKWGIADDAWFTLVNGELICKVNAN